MLTLREVGLENNGHEVFQDVCFSINKGDKVGLVGKNGIGKTTLLRLMAGDIEPTSGEIKKGELEIGLLPQSVDEWVDKSVYEFVETITGVLGARVGFEDSCKQLEKQTDDATLLLYSDSLEKFNKYEVANFDNNLEKSVSVSTN